MAHRVTAAGERTLGNTASAGPVLDSETLRRETELRAYDRYCQRGCEPGADVTDWLEAEQEVLAAHAAPAQAVPPPAVRSAGDRRAGQALRARP